MSAVQKSEIIKMIEGFSEEMLDRLLRLLSVLKEESESGRKNGGFDDLSGLISSEDAEIMKQAIEERENLLVELV